MIAQITSNPCIGVGVNSTKKGCIDQSFLKNLGRSIKGVWSNFSISFSKGLSNIASISANKSKLWDSHYKIKERKEH